jgi:hypothetical protein
VVKNSAATLSADYFKYDRTTVTDPSKEVTAVVKRGALTLTTEPVKFLETMIKRGADSTAVWAGSIAELTDDNVYPFTAAEKPKKGRGKK